MNDLSRRQVLWPGIILFSAVLWTFWPAVHNGFIGYDDPIYVTGNGYVQSGLSWKNVGWAFRTSDGGNWHPLTWLSHMIDCQLFGLAPWGHHFVSVLLHALNAALVFLALRGLTGATWRSFIVAAFFGLHPLRVESVAWAAERKDVLSGFFFTLTLLVYARYVSIVAVEKSKIENQKPPEAIPGSERPKHSALSISYSTFLYLLTLLIFALGLMSKPMLVTLPFVLLLLDYWPLRRFQASSRKPEPATRRCERSNAPTLRLVVEKLPFFVLAFLFSVITIVAQRKGGAMSLAVPFVARVENAMVCYCRYIGKILFPKNLAFFYPYQTSWPFIVVLLAILLLVAISTLAILARRRNQYLLVGWLWFTGTLVPVIGLLQVGEQALADRYTYIPSIGLFLALVWGAHALTHRWQFQGRFFGSFAAALALVCALYTRRQIGIWKDNESLFTDAIAVTRNNYIAHNNLGVTFEQQGRWEEAAAQYREAIAENPDFARAHKNLGVVLEHEGQSTNAIQEYRAAIRLNSSWAEPHNDLGAFFTARGRLDEAIEEFQQALRLKPDYADAHFNLGLVCARKGLIEAAIPEYQAALEVQPNRADVHNNLGVALDRQGRIDDAIREYVQAIELNPSYARARFNLGVALSQKGALAPAIEQFQEALKLKPDYHEARTNLNMLLQMQKAPGR